MAISDLFNSIRTAFEGFDQAYTQQQADQHIVSALKSPNDAIALLIHTWAFQNNLKLTGINGKILSNTDGNNGLRNQNDWNSNGPNFYNLEYTDTSTSKVIELEISKRFSTELQINAQDPKTKDDTSFRLKIGSYIDLDFFKDNNSERSDDISGIFVSGDDIKALWALLDRSIGETFSLKQAIESAQSAQKPRDLNTARIIRESTERSAADSSPSPASRGPGTPYGTPPSGTPSQFPHRGGLPRGGDFPLGFEDEYEINGKLRAPGSSRSTEQGPAQTPFLPIGDRDLNPPGMGPHSGLGGSGSGGMYPTMEELMRRGGRNPDSETDPDDLLVRPPGSRWDPLGPGRGSNRGGRGGFGSSFGSGFGRGFGGDFI